MVLPPTVMGYYLIVLLGKNDPEEFRAILPESFVGRLLFAPEVRALAVEETGDTSRMHRIQKPLRTLLSNNSN